MEVQLVRHPISPVPAIEGIRVQASRPTEVRLSLKFIVTGDISSIVVPGLTPTEGRADDLWQTTCFEAFVRRPDGDQYVEFNFSPSTQWAAYVFDGYRMGRRNLGTATMPRFDIRAGGDAFELGVVLDLADTVNGWRSGDLLLGLSAVIETQNRQKSYWALKHPPGDPDFHHGDCFAAVLRAPGAA
ncbi:MAG TPA: DOMON-like domain-containing protein [Sphingobium sp.]|uniref:DOMON-like domain-containing protein n=1 Tax=Sphingobium sp. TaxID=1912891 RepID=UPI002ED1D292